MAISATHSDIMQSLIKSSGMEWTRSLGHLARLYFRIFLYFYILAIARHSQQFIACRSYYLIAKNRSLYGLRSSGAKCVAKFAKKKGASLENKRTYKYFRDPKKKKKERKGYKQKQKIEIK